MACLFLRNGLAGKIMDPLAVQTPAILAPAPAVKNPAPAKNFKEIPYLKVEAGKSISV
jgi:hypothetical protein